MSRLRDFINESNESKIESEIMDFFYNNPKPDDKKIHALAEKLGIDEHKFEGYIYSILGSFLGAGKAKKENFKEKDADSKQLAMGIKVEMEHTDNKTIARRIALDHLSEIPDYYTRLDKMESEAGVKH